MTIPALDRAVFQLSDRWSPLVSQLADLLRTVDENAWAHGVRLRESRVTVGAEDVEAVVEVDNRGVLRPGRYRLTTTAELLDPGFYGLDATESGATTSGSLVEPQVAAVLVCAILWEAGADPDRLRAAERLIS